MAVSIVAAMPIVHPRPAEPTRIRIELADGIATVTLVNPARKNAMDMAMCEELAQAFRWVSTEPEARVLVVTGEGEEFCSGFDLSDATGLEQHGLARMRSINETAIALAEVPQPVIARVDGVAAGAGWNLALTCDLIVASGRARFSQIFAKRGLSVDFGGSWVLTQKVGMHRAKELALLAPIIDVAEADRLGLVNKVVPVEELDAAVGAWAAQLAAGPPIALAQTKALLEAAPGTSLRAALDAEAMAQTVNFSTKDTREALMAFLEKRTPTYTGR